jgi:hypothetical protein
MAFSFALTFHRRDAKAAERMIFSVAGERPATEKTSLASRQI